MNTPRDPETSGEHYRERSEHHRESRGIGTNTPASETSTTAIPIYRMSTP